MDHEATLKRIIRKLGVDPTLPVERCLPWPTKSAPTRPVLQVYRDYHGAPYLAPTRKKNRPRLMINGERIEVHRFLHVLMTGTTQPFVATQMCRTPFCVNPAHWDFRATTLAEAPEEGPPEPADEGWTLSEALELLDSYLLDHPAPPLDHDHNLLIDIPRPLLREALARVHKEDFLP